MLNQNILVRTAKTILFIVCFFACGTVAAAQCKGWTYNVKDSDTFRVWYLSFFKSNCDTYTIAGVPNTLKCFWPYVNGACFGYMKELEREHNDNNNKPFLLLPSETISSTQRRCYFKYSNNNGGPYESGVINLEEVPQQPFQPHCGTDNEVQGPYRKCSDRWYSPNDGMWLDERPRGGLFTRSQKNKIKTINKKKNKDPVTGEERLISDLCGVTISGYTETCEPLIDPKDKFYPLGYKDKMAQIHHIIPRKDRQGCNCGRNSFKNVLVISAKMNRILSNLRRPEAELNAVKNIMPYPCPAAFPASDKIPKSLSTRAKRKARNFSSTKRKRSVQF